MTDLQTLLAAAERLTGPLPVPVANADTCTLAGAMLDLLRPLLPGRPVPIDIEEFEKGATQWFVRDDGTVGSGDVVMQDRLQIKGLRTELAGMGCVSFGDNEGYRTRAEADREAYYRRFEALLKQAWELAQGEGK